MTTCSLGLKLSQNHYLFSRRGDQIGHLTPPGGLPERKDDDELKPIENRYSIIDEQTLKDSQDEGAKWLACQVMGVAACIIIGTAAVVVAGIFLATIYVGPIGLGIMLVTYIFWRYVLVPVQEKKAAAADLEHVCKAIQISLDPSKAKSKDSSDSAPLIENGELIATEPLMLKKGKKTSSPKNKQEEFLDFRYLKNLTTSSQLQEHLEQRHFADHTPKHRLQPALSMSPPPESGESRSESDESGDSLGFPSFRPGSEEVVVLSDVGSGSVEQEGFSSQIDVTFIQQLQSLEGAQPKDEDRLNEPTISRMQARLATYDVFRATKKELSKAYNTAVLDYEAQKAMKKNREDRVQAINEALEDQDLPSQDRSTLNQEKKDLNAEIDVLNLHIMELGRQLHEWGFHQYPWIKIHTAYARARSLRPNTDISFAELAQLTPARTPEEYIISQRLPALDPNEGPVSRVIQMKGSDQEIFESQLAPRLYLTDDQVDTYKAEVTNKKLPFFANDATRRLQQKRIEELASTANVIQRAVQNADHPYSKSNAGRISERDLSNLFIQAIDAREAAKRVEGDEVE